MHKQLTLLIEALLTQLFLTNAIKNYKQPTTVRKLNRWLNIHSVNGWIQLGFLCQGWSFAHSDCLARVTSKCSEASCCPSFYGDFRDFSLSASLVQSRWMGSSSLPHFLHSFIRAALRRFEVGRIFESTGSHYDSVDLISPEIVLIVLFNLTSIKLVWVLFIRSGQQYSSTEYVRVIADVLKTFAFAPHELPD